MHFPLIFQNIFGNFSKDLFKEIYSPYFYTFSPVFVQFTCVLCLSYVFFASPILTMMHYRACFNVQ